MRLPSRFDWLVRSLADNDGHPKMVQEAVRLYGTHEGDGRHNNPVIMAWVNEIAALPGQAGVREYVNDHRQAWCGLFMAHCAHVAGYDVPHEPLWALNWRTFGVESPRASLGDVLVFRRRDRNGQLAGHVGLYVGEDENMYHVLGGNEGDLVNIVGEPKGLKVAIRRPRYHVQPTNVVPHHDAPISTGSSV